MRWFGYIFCFLACSTVYGQKKFLTSIDSNSVVANTYIQNSQQGISLGLGDKVIVLDQFDEDLLEALVFSKINNYRKSKGKKLFLTSKPIQAIAEAYVKKYQSSRFAPTGSNYYKLKRVLNRISRYMWLSYKLYDGHVTQPIVADYKRGSFYYDKESETDLKLFYGKKKPRPNEDVELKPIEAKTYNQVADVIVKKWFANRSSQMLKGSTYQYLAIHTVLDYKSVRKSAKLPKIKAMFIVGGKRNNLLLDEMNK